MIEEAFPNLATGDVQWRLPFLIPLVQVVRVQISVSRRIFWSRSGFGSRLRRFNFIFPMFPVHWLWSYFCIGSEVGNVISVFNLLQFSISSLFRFWLFLISGFQRDRADRRRIFGDVISGILNYILPGCRWLSRTFLLWSLTWFPRCSIWRRFSSCTFAISYASHCRIAGDRRVANSCLT